MLVNGKRALAYIVTIDEVQSIPNYDRVEHVRTSGWWCIAHKGDFNVGDKALYIEIDSKCPENDERFKFLEPKHYKVKTLRMCKTYSQGLLMPLSEFPELKDKQLHEDVTELLGITYYVAEDNARKAKTNPNEKYNRMAARNSKLAKKRWFRWLMKRMWGRKLLFVFFGRVKDIPKQFPTWIKKTDEDRIENCLWMLDDKEPYVQTEKIDGTSTTVFLDLTKKKPDFGVCSRNVRQMDADQKNFVSDMSGAPNVYWEMVFKYDMKDALEKIAKEHNVKQVVLQGETYGESVQGNKYKMNHRDFAAFNLVFDGVRLGSVEAKAILDEYGIPFVPIIDVNYALPGQDNLEEFKVSADGKSTINKNVLREGFVYRSLDGQKSFKNVSRKFLMSVKD